MTDPVRHVFLDPTGSRARHLRAAALLVAALSIALLTAFGFSVFSTPKLSLFGPNARPQPVKLHRSSPQLENARRALFARISADRRYADLKPINGADTIRGAYFAPWRDNGLESFRAHAGDLTHIYPAWISLRADGKGLVTDFWNPYVSQTTKDLIRIAAANGVRVVPVVSNAEAGVFDTKRLDRMLLNRKTAANVAKQLSDFVQTNGYAGLQIDFERLGSTSRERLPAWLLGLSKRLQAKGKELSVTIETDESPAFASKLSATADYAVIMAYDEHGVFSGPGPAASANYVADALRRFTPSVGASKLVLGVGAYGYDWNVPDKTAEIVAHQQAVALLVRYSGHNSVKETLDFDAAALEPTFQYNDDKGQLHEVWFQDAVTAQNALTLGRTFHIRGAALWALGMEDPSAWRAFGRLGPAQADLRSVVAPEAVNFIGDGELLRVVRRPQAGERTYERDAATGLITDESYASLPSGWLIERSGAPNKTVALTFDDGPSPIWTPKILDVLKRHNVKATFFMIGSQLIDYPELARRVYAEGHEIGSHSFTHPDMAHVGEERVRLELSTTQRAFQAILGRSVMLFRPPYNADSEPRTYGEIMPIAVAAENGYVTAGETIDPNDWNVWRRHADGSTQKLTGADIQASIEAQLSKGQSILLHDGGLDRSATVEALDHLITTLQAKGYQFSTIGGLEGRSRDQTMPAVSPADSFFVITSGIGFAVQRIVGAILFWAFTAAIILGLLRIALMLTLAARPSPPRPLPVGRPRVDVLVAAFNEATVIERTVTSALNSQGVAVRVFVVDDGSTDRTGDVVETRFGRDPRVHLERKPNGGKASALNLAMTLSDAPIVVGVDADTQLDPFALQHLALRFADERIGAVAGNVKVGNRSNVVTRWQSVEYVTSQNIDRRALSRLNGITVVPGAIGAYRASALRAVGGYSGDTLAEDMDLTWRLRRAGWMIVNEGNALAFTEAPSSLNALLRQRFRWSFGTLQCLWKHRSALFHYGWFGWLSLPTLWLFQFVAQVLAPFVDLQLLAAVVGKISAWVQAQEHPEMPMPPDPMLWVVAGIYLGFLGLELLAGWVAYAFDGDRKGELWLLPTQRFVYRQVMYLVVWSSILRALGGTGQAWGKLARTGAVKPRDAPSLGFEIEQPVEPSYERGEIQGIKVAVVTGHAD
jgi:peptidoglycan/xylan/chitin deacetylase (PgdA/CDA1 family)/spore germination protein YaaH/GT2 family glycosyltransferase